MRKEHFDILPDTEQLLLLLTKAEELITIPFKYKETVTLYRLYDYFVEVYKNEISCEILQIETLQKEKERFNLSLYSLYISINDENVRFSTEEKKKAMIVCIHCDYGWYMDGNAKFSSIPCCPMCNKAGFKFRSPGNLHLSFLK